jgi:hypothetical protein
VLESVAEGTEARESIARGSGRFFRGVLCHLGSWWLLSVANGTRARDEIVCGSYRLRRVRGYYRNCSSSEKVADVLISRSANVGYSSGWVLGC